MPQSNPLYLLLLALAVAIWFFGPSTSPFFEACKSGDSGMVQRLLDGGQDINAKEKESGGTALIVAAGKGRTNIVQLLIDANAGVDGKNEGGWTALMVAAEKGHNKVVGLLIDAQANVHTKSKHPVGRRSYFVSVEEWEQQGGDTALIAAAKQGRTEIVQLLIDAKADVDAKTNKGFTALIAAAEKGHTEIVQLLIDAKADVENNGDVTALMEAARGGRKEVVQLLIDAKADVNAKTNDGGTALMLVSHMEVLQLLIGAKADVNAKGGVDFQSGWTTLMYAAELGRKEIVQLLIDAKADVNVTALSGWTALILAAEKGRKEIVGMLLNAKANVDAQNVYGDTALMMAVQKNYKEIFQLLINAKADIHTTNKKGETALYQLNPKNEKYTNTDSRVEIQSTLEAYGAIWYVPTLTIQVEEKESEEELNL